jgi:hypothetical protein
MPQLMLVSRPIWRDSEDGSPLRMLTRIEARVEIEDSGFKPADLQGFSAAVRPTEVASVGRRDGV